MNRYWIHVKDGNADAYRLYQRHYSARRYRERRQRLFVGPGEKTVLIGLLCDALFVWKKFIDKSGNHGVNCAVFRNESANRSSCMIEEACQIAWQRWPGQRLYTYVNPKKIRSSNPGFCFLCAGWQKSGKTKGGLVVLELLPDLAGKAAA